VSILMSRITALAFLPREEILPPVWHAAHWFCANAKCCNPLHVIPTTQKINEEHKVCMWNVGVDGYCCWHNPTCPKHVGMSGSVLEYIKWLACFQRTEEEESMVALAASEVAKKVFSHGSLGGQLIMAQINIWAEPLVHPIRKMFSLFCLPNHAR